MTPDPRKTPRELAEEFDVAARIAYDKQDWLPAQIQPTSETTLTPILLAHFQHGGPALPQQLPFISSTSPTTRQARHKHAPRSAHGGFDNMKYATITTNGFEIRIGGDVPQDAIFLTDAEFDGLQGGQLTIENGAIVPAPPPAPPTPLEELTALDSANTLTQRNLREFILLTVEAIKQLSAGAVDLSQVRGVSVVADVEREAARLRAKL